MKIKHCRAFLGLLIFGLLAKSGCADISLTLRNGAQSNGRQTYIQPHGQNAHVSRNQVGIPAKPQQPQFQESNFGKSEYHIFEVHNHFDPTKQHGQQQQQHHHQQTQSAQFSGAYSNRGGSGYLPPPQQIHIQHINKDLDTDNLDVSLLTYVAGEGHNGEQITITEHVESAPAAAPVPAAHVPVAPVPFPSSYQHDFRKQNNHLEEQLIGGVSGGGAEYLPPHTNSASIAQAHNTPQAPEYLPPSDHSQASPVEYNAPEYLPPDNGNPHNYQQHSDSAETYYKGPDYLPPHPSSYPNEQHQHADPAYHAPEYLPPVTSSHQHTEQHVELQQHDQQHYDTQPPTYKGPDYLPPHSDYPPPPVEGGYEGPGYLPPHSQSEVHQESHHDHAEDAYEAPAPGPEYSAPGYLPPGYDYNNPGSNQLPQHEQHPLPQPGPHHAFEPHPSKEEPYKAPEYLPPGYDFQEPAAELEHQGQPPTAPLYYPEQTHVPAFPQQEEQHQHDAAGQTQAQVVNHEQGADINYGHHAEHQFQAPEIRSNGYLPPSGEVLSTVQTHANYHAPTAGSYNEQGSLQHAQQESLPPVPQPGQHVATPQRVQFPTAAPSTEFHSPEYRPSAPAPAPTGPAHPDYQSHIHSLSSYMTSVEPTSTRYGDSHFTEPRKPFAQYGPPPTASGRPFGPPSANEVAPMYREQATRPQYYAPSMSYTANAFSQLNEQARKSLERFMPKDTQHHQQGHIPAAVQTPSAHGSALHTTSGTAGKIRTVQIVNTNAVKTLKVLETSDHAGVKTIKILGPSNEHPVGEHRIVKVVSQSPHNANENHVQTVKIYNDHKDVDLTGTAPGDGYSDNLSNAYVPPRVRTAVKRAVHASLQQHIRRPLAAYGRPR